MLYNSFMNTTTLASICAVKYKVIVKIGVLYNLLYANFKLNLIIPCIKLYTGASQ